MYVLTATGMVRSTLGHSLESALTTWGQLVADDPTGPGIDFTASNRTRQCQSRCETFLETPTEETFKALWSAETLAGYWAPNAAVLLGPPGAVDQLHTVVSEMTTADEFNPEWTRRLPTAGSNWGVYELYGRLQGGHNPIPSIEAKNVLGELGYDTTDDREAVIDALTEFKSTYDRLVGHASAGTAYELPVYAEIDAFFNLVATVDRATINAQLTGPYAPLFRPLIGHRFHTETSDPIEWRGVDSLIEDHITARDSGAYDDLETAHWGGTHIESWKWQFKDYVQDVIRSEFDLTALTAEEIPQFFEMIEDPDEDFDAVSNVPSHMMGGQFHRMTWNDIVAYCLDNPEEAASVLSDLFNEELPIVDRLNQFYEVFHFLTTREENDRSPGSLLRAATALLMYVYPQQHITFQYQRMDNFFDQYSTADGLDTGFNARQYNEVAIACRQLLEKIKAYSDDASMIDVQTLIYIADDT